MAAGRLLFAMPKISWVRRIDDLRKPISLRVTCPCSYKPLIDSIGQEMKRLYFQLHNSVTTIRTIDHFAFFISRISFVANVGEHGLNYCILNMQV